MSRPFTRSAKRSPPLPRPLLWASFCGQKAETTELRVSYGYSTGYLPLMIMRDQNLIEKHAAKAGLGVPLRWTWQVHRRRQ